MTFEELWKEYEALPWRRTTSLFREIMLARPDQYVKWLTKIVKEKASSRLVTFHYPKLAISALKEWDGTFISLQKLDWMDSYPSTIGDCSSEEYQQALDTRALLHAAAAARRGDVWHLKITQDQVRELL